jgi:hypothetical protein
MREEDDADQVHTLKIDKDIHVNKEWIEDYVGAVIVICRQHNVVVDSIRMCPSRRKGLHFYIQVSPPVRGELANRLQWLLGDDARRVDFNRARIDSGLKEWNKLFERPEVRLRAIYRTDAAAPNSVCAGEQRKRHVRCT